MYLFTEKELGGGICYIAKRYAKANKKYMKNHDPKKPSKFITYLDMNNLYCWAMNGYLPDGGFKWLKMLKSPIGYILEVNLEYTDELHALHKDYPWAPEKLAIAYDMLSNYRKKIAGEYEIQVGDVKN